MNNYWNEQSTDRPEQRNIRVARHNGPVGLNGPPTARVLKLHTALIKAENPMLIHIRTGCIGFKKFLHICRVPDIDSPMCDCRGGEETAEHVVKMQQYQGI